MLAPRLLAAILGLAPLISAFTQADELDPAVLETAIPTVLTPVRLKQARTEVPASVTVIDRQLIEASGLRQLAEVFRLVPGTSVGARDGWNYVVSYHGTTYRDSRRMQVMVDGRSVYQAGLATIDWNDIPVAIEDIERIEIVRGPDTAAYGANAFLGVINIVTRHPDDSPTLRLKASRGSGSTEDYYGSTSGKLGTSSYRITANGRRDSGFDENRYGNDRRDSTNLSVFNSRWTLAPLENWSLDLQGGYKYGQYTEDMGATDITPGDHHVRDWFFSATSQHFLSPHNSVKWQLDFGGQHEDAGWRTCSPAGSIGIPRTVLARNALVCGDINEDGTNQRTDLDVQDTLVGEAPWQLVSGFHLQHQRANSQTYYDGSVSRSTVQLFANYEYRFLPSWSATVGGSQEYADSIGQNFSPRLALLFLPSDEHSFRAVYSEAIRTPDLFELNANWSYTATNITTAEWAPIPLLGSSINIPLRAVAPGTMREETIRSRELGYYGLWYKRRLQTDLKWFWDDLNDLSSSSLTLSNFNPANEGAVNQTGFETEVDFRVTPLLRLRTTYALINSNTHGLPRPNNYRDYEFTPRHSGSASAIIELPTNWQVSSNYFYANKVNSNKFSRADVRIQKTLKFSSSTLRVAGIIQHDFSGQGDIFVDNLYDSPNRLLATMDLLF